MSKSSFSPCAFHIIVFYETLPCNDISLMATLVSCPELSLIHRNIILYLVYSTLLMTYNDRLFLPRGSLLYPKCTVCVVFDYRDGWRYKP